MNELQRYSAQRYNAADRVSTEAAPPAVSLVNVFGRRLWLIALIMAVSLATAAVISKRTPKAWRASAQMLLVQRAPMLMTSTQAGASAPMVESIDTQISLLQSREIAKQAALIAQVSPETLQSALSVAPPKETNLLDIAVEAPTREQAALWADAICTAFVSYKNNVAKGSSQQAIATLQGQTKRANRQVDSADQALLLFQRRNNLVDVPTQATAALNQYLSRAAEVSTLQEEYQSAQARANALNTSLEQAKKAISSSSVVRDDTQAQGLQAKLNDLEQKRLETAQRYRGKFPGVLSSLDAQIADVRNRLKASIKATTTTISPQSESTLKDQTAQAVTDAATAQAKLAAAIKLRDQLKAQTGGLPQVSMTAARLSRSATDAHALHDQLETALRTAQLDKDVASGNVQIVQHAFVPDLPFRPDHKRDLLIGGVIGLCISLLAVLLLEQSDRSLRSIQDIRKMAGGPVVGVLPLMNRTQHRQLQAGETPPQLLETYNAARVNLALALRLETGADLANHQVILVSSAVGGEGKSLTAYEMALSFARSGKHVVLVNADMRRPSSVPALRGSKGPGLAEVLSGRATLAEALVDSQTHNLSLLHSGTPVGSPMDLVALPQMRETLQTLRHGADVVIVDTPPSAIVADALLIAPHVDCLLFVIGAGMVDAETVRHSSAALAAAAPKTMAYFINRAPRQSNGPRNDAYVYHRQAVLSEEDVNLPHEYQSTRTMVLERAPAPQYNNSAGNGAGQDERSTTMVGASPLRPVNAIPVGPAQPVRVGSDDDQEDITSTRILPQIGGRLIGIEGTYAGYGFPLSANGTAKIGTLPDNDIVLARDGTVSQRHAHLVNNAQGATIYDDYSTNGTFVNDVRIWKHEMVIGDVLQFGGSKFRYE